MGVVTFSLSAELAEFLELPFGYTVCQRLDDSALENVPYFWDCVAYRNSSGWHRCKKYLPVSLDTIQKLAASDNDAFLGSEDWLFVELENPEASFLRLAILDDDVIFADENDCVELEFSFIADGNPTYATATVHTEHRTLHALLEMLQSDEFWGDEETVWQFFSNAVLCGAKVERTYRGLKLGVPYYSYSFTLRSHHASYFFPFADTKNKPYKDKKSGLWRIDGGTETKCSFSELRKMILSVEVIGNGMEDES